MFKNSSTNGSGFHLRLLHSSMVIAVCLGALALTATRQSRSLQHLRASQLPATDVKPREDSTKHSTPTLQGAPALEYLEKTDDGRSLAKAATAARFGLKWQERSDFGDENGGYLGMSHVQNLNAWFDAEGVTIRPTMPEAERAKAWRLGMRLKAYGYGTSLAEPPPVVARKVEENRIEYERANCQLPIANCQLENIASGGALSVLKSAIGYRQSSMTEWYENRAAGIEQGFTLNSPPGRGSSAANEPLRLTLKLEGDLHARANGNSGEVQLLKQDGDAVLSYGQLIAKDSKRRKLPSRMETNSDGSEIVLLVQDAGATYPIDIDPITATLEKPLTEPTPQVGAEFGDAVAISGNVAVIGAFREDFLAAVDGGRVYIFTRSGSTWTPKFSSTFYRPSSQCGWSVAISPIGDRVAFGCPGYNSNTGVAELLQSNNNWSSVEAVSLVVTGVFAPKAGDRYGESVGLGRASLRDVVVIGAPFTSQSFPPFSSHVGALYLFDIFSDFSVYFQTVSLSSLPAEAHSGASLAIDGDNVIVGAPGTNSQAGAVESYLIGPANGGGHFLLGPRPLFPNDGSPADVFGYSVAMSGNTAVVGAPQNENANGKDAGAAYVFVRDNNGNWVQQQKLIASDGIDFDQFGQSVAIEGNTVIVGSPYVGPKSFTGTRGNGRSYVFTRNINTWTEQTIISALFDGAPVDKFGIAVAFSGNTVISGAEHATANGASDAGAVYIHRLSCVPPGFFLTIDTVSNTSGSICPGTRFFLLDSRDAGGSGLGTEPFSYQWRKNGVNIPGATQFYYEIKSASASDTGIYDIIVSNACGAEIAQPYALTVYTMAVFPTTENIGSAGTSGLLAVNATGSCPWTAQSNASWITVTSGTSGTGNGNVGFRVDPNPGTSQRTGTMTVAGQTVTFTQDAAAPPNAVQFSSSSYSVQEDCTTVAITVNRIGDTSGAASVDYNTSDVTASERKDYITALGKLQFAPGETSKSFAVLINEDSFVEGNETFNLNLSNPSGVSLGGPAVATVTIIDDVSEPATNAIDDPADFVCQHYHDFLNRQPDPSGLAFWTGNLTSCGTDAACIENRRSNVSAAFYLSIEFQQTGYLVERVYKSAYGDASGNSTFPSAHQMPVPVVRLNEFLSDTQEIGQGVVVGQGNWQQQLENNKQVFTNAFVQRSRFLTAFPISMTAAQFVDTLNAHAGTPLSSAERDQLVNDLASNAKTRAQALRQVAEHPNLVNSEFNRAFVLMQFFGYLRRNPNDPQDTDYTGYDFWLTKLNQFSGNYIDAEMVRAFITSIEYRQRFGP